MTLVLYIVHPEEVYEQQLGSLNTENFITIAVVNLSDTTLD